ncbi:FibroRumin family radical SAM-modified Cys-rich RiPP [Peptacetobacter sp. AB845]|uniref:FibroRumin family radical SAM-modified Cys-rich RiPP n=1 Tax=Peptacetobacter sp. AB845 TaxID=3388429 RepID=UPI0039C921B7
MIANSVEYAKMFGIICDGVAVMARCACVACNSCTCACSCRNIPDFDEIDW